VRNLHLLNAYRVDTSDTHGSMGDGTCGCFRIPSPIDGQPLLIQASSDGGWDHISISRKNRPPNWTEMARVHRLFFKDDEVAMQLHVPIAEHVNVHPNCLHLFRPQLVPIPRPPSWMI
jgi:hypothetical protein